MKDVVCFGALKWLDRSWKVFETETKKLEKKIKLINKQINILINNSSDGAFQGQWKQKVAGNKAIPFISTVSFDALGLINECGPVIENTIRSPGYPNDYPNNTDCFSWVRIPQGMVINITINELYLEKSTSCE